MNAIIIDTECTGLVEPDVIQLAHTDALASPKSDYMDIHVSHFRPRKPITLGALATHHITEDSLKDSPAWTGSWSCPYPNVKYFVGHNIDFDWKAMGSPDVKRICTLALARKYWPDLDSHSLGALTYHIYSPTPNLAREFVKSAHNAHADVGMTYRILWSLLECCGNPATWEELWQLSESARVPTHFSFGKFGPKDGKKGLPIAEVRKIDPGYIRWCLNNADIVKNDPYWQKALTA